MEIIYDEQEKTRNNSFGMLYLKLKMFYQMLFLSWEGKPMGAVSAFTTGISHGQPRAVSPRCVVMLTVFVIRYFSWLDGVSSFDVKC